MSISKKDILNKIVQKGERANLNIIGNEMDEFQKEDNPQIENNLKKNN